MHSPVELAADRSVGLRREPDPQLSVGHELLIRPDGPGVCGRLQPGLAELFGQVLGFIELPGPVGRREGVDERGPCPDAFAVEVRPPQFSHTGDHVTAQAPPDPRARTHLTCPDPPDDPGPTCPDSPDVPGLT